MKRKLEFFDVERPKYNTCKCGKVCFTKQEAHFKIKFLTKIKGREPYLRAYQCPLSDKWHLTKLNLENFE